MFTKEGRFVQELILAGTGRLIQSRAASHFRVTLSRNISSWQTVHNHVIRVLNRKDGSYVARFGSRGRNAGQFDPELIRGGPGFKGKPIYVGNQVPAAGCKSLCLKAQ